MSHEPRQQQGLRAGVLGRDTGYPSTYMPSLLHSLERAGGRQEAGVVGAEALRGEDLWTGYEFSWLDTQGKPVVAGVRFRVPCQSPSIVESKSIKLYLNSFAQTKFESQAAVLRTLDQDISLGFRSPVMIELLELPQLNSAMRDFPGICLDDLDIRTGDYERNPEFLQLQETTVMVRESLYTHLFRSLCPVTAQPDWASVLIEYSGAPIDRAGLLKYLISYRTHQAFHETTIERIHLDILEFCAPEMLTVYGRFQRRGGLDINPFRSTDEDSAPQYRLPRQ